MLRTASAVFILLALFPWQTSAQTRVALVIGNSAYRHVSELANPKNDGNAVAAALNRLNFKVWTVEDGDFDGMRRALLHFSRKVYGAEIAIVFFAGHGMEIGGENWLIPVDAELKSDIDAEQEAISLRSIILSVSGASKLGMVILDACRDNPFAVRMERSVRGRAVERGLARIEPTGSVLVAYAAKDGTTASDGTGRHSPFTTALLSHIETPDLEVNFLFRNVRDDVLTATHREQEPYVYGALSKEAVYLKAITPKPGPDGVIAPSMSNVPALDATPKIVPPKLSLPAEIPTDPDILRLVESHPFFATADAPPVLLGSYRTSTSVSYTVNRVQGTTSSDDSYKVSWLRQGIVRSDSVQKSSVRHTACPPGACVMTIRTESTLAGNGLISLGYRSSSNSSFGSTVTSKKLIRFDNMQGTIFPVSVGNRFSYRATYQVVSPSADEEVSENSCEFVDKFEAKRFHSNLNGDVYLLACRFRTTHTNKRSANFTGSSKELFFERLGTWMSVDSVSPKERIVQTNFDDNTVQEIILREFTANRP